MNTTWFICSAVNCSCSRLLLRSFPTRRSSDLMAFDGMDATENVIGPPEGSSETVMNRTGLQRNFREAYLGSSRSEEHTSELQSRGHLVCRLLLEKKNQHCEPLQLASLTSNGLI